MVGLTQLPRLSEKETDMRDKLMPSVNYLQRLGPEYLDLVFQHSRWVFEQDHDIAFEVRRPDYVFWTVALLIMWRSK